MWYYVHFHFTIRTNPYGFPYFSSILEQLYQLESSPSPRQCSYYGYVNGDILLDTRLPNLLMEYSNLSSSFRSPLFIGKRTNVHFLSDFSIDSFLPSQYQNLIQSYYREEEQFLGLAMDYFIFTKTTFDSSFRQDIVIGRDMIDSYIFHYGYTSSHVDVIDISDACTN